MFALSPRKMTVSKLGLEVNEEDDIHRVNNVLASFARGFNAMITATTPDKARAVCDSMTPFQQPFTHEGMAMGYCLHKLFHYRSDAFEREVVKPGPEFRYLYYVGLGFWAGMRKFSAQKLASMVEGLDPLHKYLCYDGFGFKYAFFDHAKDAQALHRLERLPGYARNAAYQGVGRAFYFRFMGVPDKLIEEIRALGPFAADAAAGLGLAAVFVNPDRLEAARVLVARMPEKWHRDIHLGMCFGLKARSINHVDQFEHDVSRLERDVQDAVFASVRECDRIELLVRSEGGEDGYRRWRGLVTDWMASHIAYPLAGFVTQESASPLTNASANI